MDLFIEEPFDFAAEYRAASVEELSPETKVPVVCLETLLEMKRLAGRPQDLADVDSLEQIRRLRNEGENE